MQLEIPTDQAVGQIRCEVCREELQDKPVIHYMLSFRSSNALGTLASCVKAGRICRACWLRADVGPVVQVGLGLKPSGFLKCAQDEPSPTVETGPAETEPA